MLGIKARGVGEEVVVYVWVESEQNHEGRSVVKATSKVVLHNIGNDGYSFVRQQDGTIKAELAPDEGSYEEEDEEDYTFDQVKYDEAKKKVEDGLKRLREM
ncbi:MAG: hypothetical protein ABIH67_02605 [Candidatus Uhrbacteria bacterium]